MLSFLGHGNEKESSIIELTYNYSELDYTHTATNGQRDVIAFVEDPHGYRIEMIST